MKSLKNIVQTGLLAAALTAPIYAQETQKAQTTTQNAVATAVGNTANNAGKITQVSATVPKILDVLALEFKKQGDTEKLVGEAERLGLEIKEKIDDEKKFETLKKQITPLPSEAIKALKFENKEDIETLKKEMARYGIEGEIVSKGKFALYRVKTSNACLDTERAIIQEEGKEADRRAEKLKKERNEILQDVIRLAEKK